MAEQDNIATLAATIKAGISNHMKDVHTSLPGKVVSFNAAKQTASVQPLIKRIFKTKKFITGNQCDVKIRKKPVYKSLLFTNRHNRCFS